MNDFVSVIYQKQVCVSVFLNFIDWNNNFPAGNNSAVGSCRVYLVTHRLANLAGFNYSHTQLLYLYIYIYMISVNDPKLN